MKISMNRIKRELLDLIADMEVIAIHNEVFLVDNKTVYDTIEEYFNKLKMDMKG